VRGNDGNMMSRIKICCIASIEEASMAITAGASALGLVAEMPSGPGVIDDEAIREIATWCPPGIATFLLTSRTNAAAIIEHAIYCRTNTLQLVDAVTPEDHHKIKKALPNIKLVQVVHVRDESSLEELAVYEESVDALLLDSGNPGLNVKELGGTGRLHNWDISREIVQKSNKPVFLAGGLNSDNVSEAIRQVRPFALDICSGVRTKGRLDENKLTSFVRATKGPH
jgi:phosphoribosylanthranilate isomerase